MSTTIQKWGNSQAIRIPKSVLDAVRWKPNEQVKISAQDNKIIIEKAEHKKTIEERFADFDGEYTPENIDWGNPVGNEIW